MAALATVSGAAAVVLAVVVALLAYRLGSAGAAADAEDAPAATATTSAAPTVTDVYETVAASVVVVRTADGSLGSGVVAADDGTILTANHVIADGSAVTVTFADGTESTATVSATDATTDIASLLPATLPEVLVPATIGGGVEVGATVIAIGNPLQLTLSLSTGVVSGLERSGETAAGEIDGLIQFDASVNAGSSGGPLLDETGTVVGIVVAIADPGEDGAFAGIGFAVPIAAAVDGGTGGQGPQL
ncbi:MAG TPA: trypsin-like peptidase domain-containing protein [Cellulomonas sp.]